MSRSAGYQWFETNTHEQQQVSIKIKRLSNTRISCIHLLHQNKWNAWCLVTGFTFMQEFYLASCSVWNYLSNITHFLHPVRTEWSMKWTMNTFNCLTFCLMFAAKSCLKTLQKLKSTPSRLAIFTAWRLKIQLAKYFYKSQHFQLCKPHPTK